MRCRNRVTGTVRAVGAIKAFGTRQARAIGRCRAVTGPGRGPVKLGRGGRRSSRSECAAQCDEQLQAQIAPSLESYSVVAILTAIRPKNCRARLHNAVRKFSAGPLDAFFRRGQALGIIWPAIAAHRGRLTSSWAWVTVAAVGVSGLSVGAGGFIAVKGSSASLVETRHNRPFPPHRSSIAAG